MTGFPEPKVIWTACTIYGCDQIEGTSISTATATSMGIAGLFVIESNLTVESVLRNQLLYTCTGQNNVSNNFGDDVSSSSFGFLKVQGV